MAGIMDVVRLTVGGGGGSGTSLASKSVAILLCIFDSEEGRDLDLLITYLLSLLLSQRKCATMTMS